MSILDDPYPDYFIDSRSFLKRARKNLQRFDEGDAASIFYAALELRFGIEARLYEYMKPVFTREGLSIDESEYAVSKLLKKLQAVAGDADMNITMTSYNEETYELVTSLEYTPVTTKLANMHGKLGGMLHYNFYTKNKSWFMPISMKHDRGQSLVDCRAFLQEVVTELAEATRGTLLGPPKFAGEIVQGVIEERSKNKT